MLAAARDHEERALLAIVRAGRRGVPLEEQRVSADVDGVTGLHCHDLLGRERAGGDNAEHANAHAEMRDDGAERGARQSDEARKRDARRRAEERDALGQIDEASDENPHAKRQAEWCERALRAGRDSGGNRCEDRRGHRRAETLRGAEKIAALPTEQRPEGQCQEQRDHQRHEGQVEERCADRNFVARQRFERERIERADEDGRHCGDEEEVVEDERALAADRREKPALFHLRRTDREERQRAADEEHQDGEDEDAARRIGGEGVHRGQHAGAHEEGAEQRQREGEDGEKHCPHFERAALFHDDGGVEQRRSRKPRHERGVLDRIPEPPAAPAELVIGPVGAHRDAGGQEHPGDERPRPHPARPGGVGATF